MATYLDEAAWSDYFKARRESLVLAWTLAKGAYKSFKQVRSDLAMPIIDEADGGAWSSSLAQDAVDLQAMVQLLVDAADDVVSGLRGVQWDETTGDFFIEKLPTDKLRLDVTGGKPVLVDTSGKSTHAQGQLSAVVDSDYVTSLARYLDIEQACAKLRALAEQKTLASLSSYRQGLLSSSAQMDVQKTQALVKAIEDSSQGAYSTAYTKLAKASDPPAHSGWTNSEKILFVSAMAGVIGVAFQIYRATHEKAA